jgi:PASTA domain
LVEHSTENRGVAGSSPAPATAKRDLNLGREIRRTSSTAVLLIALALAAIAPAGAAAKATLTLGSSLPFTNAGLGCSCTLVQAASANPGETFVSPVDGVITRWRVRGALYGPGADTSLGLALRVLGSDGGSNFTGIGTSAIGQPQTREVETFPTHLPIRAGQSVGIDVPNGLFIGEQTVTGLPFGEIKPALADGATAAPTMFSGEALEFNADVLPTPTIALLSPAGGTAPQQTMIGILGTNFEEVEGVAIGGTPAASYEVRSEALIATTIPAGLSPGRLEVTVTTPAGTASSTFDYAPAPSAPPPAPQCVVPKLAGKKLKASKKRIRAADCKVGTLTKRHGATARTGKVVKQVPKPGVSVPVGTKVTVTLGRPSRGGD